MHAIETLNQLGGRFLAFAWPMLWQSSLLIMAVWTLDRLLARRVRAAVRHALWLVVLAKLLLPPTLALPTGAVWWLFPAHPVVQTPPPHFVVTYDEAAPQPDFVPASVPPPAPPPPQINRAGWLLLGTGGVSVGLCFWLLLRWRQIVGLAGRGQADENFSAMLKQIQQQAGLRAPPRLKLVNQPLSPAVCGLFAPVILLPRALAEHLSPAQLRAVLLHETFHLRRGDIWVNCAQSLLQILYWWHPLVWLANTRMRRVREEAVDDAVMLALAGEADLYAPTLLEVARLALRRPLLSLGLVGIMESRSALRQRIERLMDFRAPRRAGLSLVSICGLCAFSAVALPMGKAPAPVITLAANDTGSSTPAIPAPADQPSTTKPAVAAAAPDSHGPEVLMRARFYQMPAADFAALTAGLKFTPARETAAACWTASPEQYSQLLNQVEKMGSTATFLPRVQTLSGIQASFFVGNDARSTELDCLPTVADGQVDLATTCELKNRAAGVTTTNRFQAMARLPDHGGLALQAPDDPSNSVMFLSVEIITNLAAGLVPATPPGNSPTETLAIRTFKVPASAFAASLENEAIAHVDKVETNTVSGWAREFLKRKGVHWESPPGKSCFYNNQLGVLYVKATAADLDTIERALNTLLQQQGYVSPAKPAALDRIRLSVNYQHLRLDEVIRQLNEAARQNDPEKSGFRIALATNSVMPRWEDLNAVQIGNVALTDVRLEDVLDALAIVAQPAITYYVRNGEAIFSARTLQPLAQRTYKVDERTFPDMVRAAVPAPAGHAAPLSQADLQAYFGQLGIDWQASPDKALFYSPKNGGLFVRATDSDLNKIELLLEKLNSIPPQIHLKARFINIPIKDKPTLARLDHFLTLTNPADERPMGILTGQQMNELLQQLKSTRALRVASEPEVTLFQHRQVQIKVTDIITIVTNMAFNDHYTNTSSIEPQTTALDVGTTLDSSLSLDGDGYTLHLTATAQTTDFFGYAKIPARARARKFTDSQGEQIDLPAVWPAVLSHLRSANASLRDDQTLLLPLDQARQIYYHPPDDLQETVTAKHIRNARKKDGEYASFVFITPTLVDPAGRRIHRYVDEIQLAIPSQNQSR